jgi:hypothetical protein
MTEPPDWHRFARLCLEWLHPMRDLEPEPWIANVVERAHGLGIDALIFDLYHGGTAIFDGSVAAKDRHVGDADLLALLDREVHARDMRLLLMHMGGHCAPAISDEHPTWRVRDPDGGQTARFEQTPLMCLNSPYGNFMLQEFAELLPRYRIDGLYLEGLYGVSCYCAYCRREWEVVHGTELPTGAEAAREPAYAAFRAGNITNYIRRVRRVLDDVSPQTVLMPCPSANEGVFSDFAGWAPYADAISLERPWGYERTGAFGAEPPVKPLEIGLGLAIVQAESHRPAVGDVWIAWGVDHDYAPSTAEHYRRNVSEVVLVGATPQLHAQTHFDLDESEAPTVREMFGFVESLQPSMRAARPVPYAALVVDWRSYVPTANFKGFYQALQEEHVPFEVVSQRDLTEETLARYRVVALPDVQRLSDEQVEAVQAFARGGGGVVLTFRAGCAHPDGTPRDRSAFAELAGVAGPFGVVTQPPGREWGWQNKPYLDGEEAGLLRLVYWRVTDEHEIGHGYLGRLQSFHGSYAELETTEGRAVATALDYDYSKMHRHHPVTGWYPGREVAPLVVVNEPAGGGRVVYVAGELDRAVWETGMPGAISVLAAATRWAAAAPPPMEVDGPPTLAASAFVSEEAGTGTVVLVNRTTNELLDPDPIVRHVVPLRDVELRLRDPLGSVTNVTAFGGLEPDWRRDGDECTVTIPVLRDYAALVLQLEAEAG